VSYLPPKMAAELVLGDSSFGLSDQIASLKPSGEGQLLLLRSLAGTYLA
jgi:hypothetical protein